MRTFLKTRFPKLWSAARVTKDRVRLEYYLLRSLNWRHLLSGFRGGTGQWESLLPYQSVRRILVPSCDIPTVDVLLELLKRDNVSFFEGSIALYLPPESIERSVFRLLRSEYPEDAGLKLLKKAGGVGVSAYGAGLVRKVVDRYLLLAGNMLYEKGVGPRIYDLVELECGGQVWTSYVMQHVKGRTPTIEECKAGVEKIRAMETEGLLKTVANRAYDCIDFQPPDCNGNAVIDGEGRFRYIDFQNFIPGDYEKYLDSAARLAADDSHFGGRRLLGGGRFLYQSIPAVNLPAKRSVQSRSPLYLKLMEQAGVSVKDRLVLDVGCNIGMMIAEYLRWGAKWCHGWDFPNVVPHTQRLLLALGCTRFSTTGAQLQHDRRLDEDLPAWLRNSMQGCAISYLAVHGHIGWVEALQRIPWGFLIYEGHEQDTRADVERHLRELAKVIPFETRAMSTSEDGASRERLAAILVRKV